MLFQLGAVTIDSPGPFNATDFSEEFGADFAVKPVVGALQDREFVGEADNRITISGTLLPYFWTRSGFDSGLSEIEELRAMAKSGAPQLLMRGDGTSIGNFLVEKVSQKATHLSQEGIGMTIAYDISLVRTDRDPSASTALGTLTSILSGFQSLFS